MPRLAVLSVLSAASSPCPDLNLIHYILAVSQPATASAYTQLRNKAAMTKKGRLKPKFWVSDDLFAWRIYPIAVIFSAVELVAGNALCYFNLLFFNDLDDVGGCNVSTTMSLGCAAIKALVERMIACMRGSFQRTI